MYDIDNSKTLKIDKSKNIMDIIANNKGFWIYDALNSQLYLSNGELFLYIDNKDEIFRQLKEVINSYDYHYLETVFRETIRLKKSGFSSVISTKIDCIQK